MIALFVLVLGGVYFISDDINKNTNLDDASVTLLSDLGVEYENNLNGSIIFTQQESEVTENSTFEGVDAFVRQYLEDKSEVKQKEGILNKILLFPSLIIKIFGVESQAILIAFSSMVYGLLILFISLQIYKAVRTGEVD